MTYFIHPDDEPTPRYGNGWDNDFNTFREACAYYGCDHPDDLEAEFKARDEEEFQRQLDDIEINGPRFRVRFRDDEIPF